MLRKAEGKLMAAIGTVLMALSLSGKAADVVTILVGEEPIKGTILQYDEQGFTFCPADMDTPVYMHWHTLCLSERERLKTHLGFAREEEREGTPVDRVDGVVLTLEGGEKLRGVFLPERETDGAYYIKTTRTPHFEVKKSDIVSIKRVRLPETQVYSLEELYIRKLAEIKPITARDHFEMARWCMKVELYEKARDHLVRCTIIDPLYEDRTEGLVAEIKVRVEENSARGLFDAINSNYGTGRYDEALRLIAQIQAAYPDSRYTTEATVMKPEIEARRGKVLKRQLVNAGYRKLDELIRKKVWNRIPDGTQIMGVLVQLKSGDGIKGKLVEENDQLVVLEKDNNTYQIARDQIADMKPVPLNPAKLREATFTECKEYVTDREGGITADLMAALSRQFRIGEEEVKEIWDNRAKRTIKLENGRTKVESPAAQLREAKYAEGTWLRDDSVERYRVDFKKTTSTTSYTNVYGRRVSTPKKTTTVDVYGAGGGELEQDVDKWWMSIRRESRYRILKAVCAEAIMEVVKVFKDRCSACGGKGYNLSFDMTGSAFQRTCPRCRGLRCTVRVLYR